MLACVLCLDKSHLICSPLALRLGLVHIVAPDVDAMATNQNSVRIRVFVHGLLKELGQVLLVGRVLNDRDTEGIMIAEVSRLAVTATEALDLLNVVDLEHTVGAFVTGVGHGLEDEGNEDSPVRMRVDAASGAAARKGGEEERCALGRLVGGRRAEVGTVLEGGFLRGEGEDVDVLGLHELLLDSRGRDVDKITGREEVLAGVVPGEWKGKACSSRMEAPPPVPVTQPRVQNFAQSEGMRLAGCSGSSEVTSLSGLSSAWEAIFVVVTEGWEVGGGMSSRRDLWWGNFGGSVEQHVTGEAGVPPQYGQLPAYASLSMGR